MQRQSIAGCFSWKKGFLIVTIVFMICFPSRSLALRVQTSGASAFMKAQTKTRGPGSMLVRLRGNSDALGSQEQKILKAEASHVAKSELTAWRKSEVLNIVKFAAPVRPRMLSACVQAVRTES
jgi:hypothetical protein